MANGKIKADQIEHSTAGSLDTQYVVNGSAKAWSQVKQTDTFAVNDSFNISSGVDVTTGVARMNLSASFANTTFSGHCTNDSSGWGHNGCIDDVSTSRYDMYQMQTDTTGAADTPRTQSVAFGDLA